MLARIYWPCFMPFRPHSVGRGVTPDVGGVARLVCLLGSSLTVHESTRAGAGSAEDFRLVDTAQETTSTGAGGAEDFRSSARVGWSRRCASRPCGGWEAPRLAGEANSNLPMPLRYASQRFMALEASWRGPRGGHHGRRGSAGQGWWPSFRPAQARRAPNGRALILVERPLAHPRTAVTAEHASD